MKLFAKLIITKILITYFITSISYGQGSTCAGATSITSNATCVNQGFTIGNGNSGTGSSSCVSGINDDSWHSFTATGINSVIDLTGASNNVAVVVYSGGCGTLTEIGCDDQNTTSASVSATTSVGATYHIRLIRTNNGGGSTTGNICVTGSSFITPGNVGTTNLTAWFKSDALALGNVSTWTTTFPTGGSATTVTDATAPYPLATNTPAGDVSNYNTTLEFTNNTISNLKALQNTSSPNFLNNLNAVDKGTFFCAYLFPVSTSNNHLVLYNETGLDAIQLRNLGGDGMLAIGLDGNSTRGARRWTEGFVPSIVSYKGNKSGASTMNLYDRNWESTVNTASGSTGPTGLYFGVKPSVGTSPLNGYLHEVIFYNSDLTNLQITKINTYLAVKYGITLLNTGGGTQGDYIATNSSTIWDASTNTSYHNNVVAIGRDDNQGLLQKQSHSYNDTTRIYLNTLAATNTTNGGVFSNDISYITIGENQGVMHSIPTATAEVPTGLTGCAIAHRIEREWKVTRTNVTEDFSWDVTINNPATNPASVNVAHLRLLIDDDGDFSNGGTACYYNGDGTGLTISYSNPIITFTGISTAHIPNNSTRYMAIASINSLTPLPVEMISFNAICNDGTPTLEWTTASEINNDYFTIERSEDAINFEVVETITGNGNSVNATNYSWIDNNPLNETAYYRLKQTDFNGDHKYHKAISIDCNAANDVLIYPNPFQGYFTIQLPNNIVYPINLEIMDYLGRTVHRQIIKSNVVSIVTDKLFRKGTYNVRIYNESTLINRRLIKAAE
ncbi:MAG: T9SS type A sorting domain-containing protein [Vicingaceae bacterium]|nr:T9SS type A sorting domain-containing protein [Vicingaceae bacterium]